MLTDVDARLKKERQQGLGLLETSGVGRFDGPADALLSDVLGIRPVSQPSSGEQSDPLAKLCEK
jgi:hypothetical protein